MRWEQVQDPVPGPEEVLIEVRACGLNHSDLDSRAGSSRWPFGFPTCSARSSPGTSHNSAIRWRGTRWANR